MPAPGLLWHSQPPPKPKAGAGESLAAISTGAQKGRSAKAAAEESTEA